MIKRFGLSAVATARELCPAVPVLAHTKTVDGGQLEADAVLGAGATLMTVLSCASRETHDLVCSRAAAFGALVIVDTISELDERCPLPSHLPQSDAFAYVGLHSPSDARGVGDRLSLRLTAMAELHTRGLRVSPPGGIGPPNLDAAIAARPEIIVVGSAITDASNPSEAAQWIRSRLPEPGRGWPWDAK